MRSQPLADLYWRMKNLQKVFEVIKARPKFISRQRSSIMQ
jgi:hypothetical protein